MIHYMTGKEDATLISTKTGCGVPSENIGRNNGYVYWRNRQSVDCSKCLVKIAAVLKLHGK